MRRTCSDGNLVEPVNKIECFLCKRRWNLRMQVMAKQVVDTNPLKDYVIPTEEEYNLSIMHPLITENNFELKPFLIGMVQ